MGLKVSGIFIDSLPQFEIIDNIENEKLKIKLLKLSNLSPKNISISFSNEKTVILFDSFLENILTEELKFSNFEKKILEFFPNSSFISIIINETIDFTGFSLSSNNRKIRVKATFKGDIFIDQGPLIGTEYNIYENFIKSLKKDNIKFFESLKNAQPNLNETEFSKFVMIVKDNLHKKIDPEYEYGYKNSDLDKVICEDLLRATIGKEYFEIEKNVDFYQVEDISFNLKNDFKMFLNQSYELYLSK